MNIEKIKDKKLLLKMKEALDSQIKRIKTKEIVSDEDSKLIDEFLMEDLKIDIRLEELG